MRAMPDLRVLVTGFEPFGGDSVNPSWLVAQHLSRASIAGVQVQAVQLPCVFGLSAHVLAQALAQHPPDVVLALGLAQGRDGISIERVAINVDDARVSDNAGQQPIDTPVVPGGPAAYFSTLPIKHLVQGLQQAGHAAHISQTAGTFVCNHVFYALQHHLHGQPAMSGFVHLPALPEQAARAGRPTPPSMALADQVAAVQCLLQLCVSHRADGSAGDVRVSGGAIH
jgi:pyroglutamyl-peptidase